MGEELIFRLVTAVVMGGSGVLILRMARAAATGKLGRNQVAGIRTPSTLVSDEAWTVAHQRAEGPTRWAGWCAIAGGASALLPFSLPVMVLCGLVLASCLGMLAFVLYGASVGGKAARALTDGT
ncbi:SdpI family protein [Arthrobacter sp. RIT-PI-e]|uniref:SdpI family protein n=1 Tax=Arthrobacter sp. RIT-PI-e TaxID=1681197 RepID=UPI0006762544|nr:SdpI family protein [Arthrobacter sp. RIT-PI-e]